MMKSYETDQQELAAYKAIIKTGFDNPYDLLLKNMKEHEQKLIEQKNTLQKALDEIKLLKGILPICSHCKKIRDDKGVWKQIEAYIRDHSDADFSHSICPDCIRKFYKELDDF